MKIVYDEYIKSFFYTDKDWKREYTSLFGKTAFRHFENTYQLKGIKSKEFFQHCKNLCPDTEKMNYDFRRSYDLHDDNDVYYITEKNKQGKNCPQILNNRSLFCLKKLLDLVRQNNLNTDDIIGKTLDSLIVKKKLEHFDGFREREKIIKQNLVKSVILKNELEVRSSHLTQFNGVKINKVNYVLGSGGSGKTHYLSEKYKEMIMAFPTWDLIEKKQAEFKQRGLNHIKCITHHRLMGQCSIDKRIHYQGIIVVDEITQRHPEELTKIIEMYPECILYLLGDIHTNGIPFQCVSSDKIEIFNIENPMIFTSDYRSINEETKQFKQIIRETMADMFEITKDEYFGIQCLKQLCLNHLKLHVGEIDKQILTGSRWLTEYYGSKDYNVLNAHRVQGMTIENDFIIDLNCQSLQKIYTCISRCRDMNQIYLIDSSLNEEVCQFRKTYFK
jgi:hypothetical protein